MVEHRTGIYEIQNTTNGKCYIGSAGTSFHTRRLGHLSELRRGCHGNEHLQHSFNKYGESAFEFALLEEVVSERGLLIEREQWWLDNTTHDYNIQLIAESPLGVPMSDEAKKKLSRAITGRKLPESQKRNISKALKGIKRSDEFKEKLRQANLGKKHTKEAREKIGRIWRGKKLSPEHRAKIAKGNTGRVQSEECKAKISAARKGKKLSKEHRRKLSEAHKGKVPWNKGLKIGRA